MRSISDTRAILKLFEGIGQRVDPNRIDPTKPAKSIKTIVRGAELWHHENSESTMHREDGPAFVAPWGEKFYYLFDKLYPKVEDWAIAVLKLHKKPHDAQAVHDLLRTVLKQGVGEAL